MAEDLLSFLKPDAAFGIGSYALTLAFIEMKSHEYNSYTILGMTVLHAISHSSQDRA